MRLLLVSLAALVLLVPARGEAVYQCGAQVDTCRCGANDPYPCCSNNGNCTWWAWEAACCNWGTGLGSWGNANQWQGNARAHGYDIRDCHTPVVGTIANRVSGSFGHVAWVTSLNGGGGVHVQEQNCDYGPGSMDEQNYRQCYFDGGFIARGGQVQCNPGDSQTQGCGVCGAQGRGCGADGRWGGWGGCGGAGSCTPGQVDVEGCGRCGTHSRTCGGNCQWGDWSGCGGEGECSPGQTESQACCDCGTTQKSCDGACHWQGWGACAGPDPVGASACATGKPGACAEGQSRCVAGCLACMPLHAPSPEVCDGVDNDCNGLVDDGSPRQFGNPPPAFAASVVDGSFPRSMAPGSMADAWFMFRNDGSATWRAGAVSLRADAPSAGKPSRLMPARGWPAYDTVAVLDQDVAPGATAALRFPFQVGPGGADIAETFTLTTPEGKGMACPEATVAVAIATVGAAPAAGTPAPPAAKPKAGCGTFDAGAGALLLAGFARRRRRR
jgi:surface antigen